MSTNRRKKLDNKKQLILLVVFLIVAAGFFFFLSKTSAKWSLLKISVGTNPPISAKIVSTQAERVKGLMYVKSLPVDQGMLFVFPNESVQSFWMKETYIPLDMLFISKERKIVGALKNVPVLNTVPRSVPEKSLYVLELPAGSADKFGFQVGAEVNFHGPVPVGIK